MPPPAADDPRIDLARRRTAYATFRTSLALDRTTLAWIRTALTFETFGLGMVGFYRAVNLATRTERSERLHQLAIHVGVMLVVIGMFALLISAWSHVRALRALRRGAAPPLPVVPLSVAIGSCVALLCLYALWLVFRP